MKKLLPILVLIISLEISAQLQCTQYDPDYCEIFNNDFTLKCQKFSGSCLDVQVDSGCKIENDQCIKNDNKNANEICKFYDVDVFNSYYTSTLKMCKKVLIDDGCIVTDNYGCTASDTSPSSKVKCEMNEDKNHCQKFDKVCTDYSDNNCGDLKTEVKPGVTQQCIKLPINNECSDIIIDEHCKATESLSERYCEPRPSTNFDSDTYKCELNTKSEKIECKRRPLTCTELASDKCTKITNCKAINLGSKTCQIVTIDSPTCKIDDNGDCVLDNGNDDYQECSFVRDTDGNYKCRASNKYCSSITNTAFCENGATIDKDNKCRVLTISGTDLCVEVVKTHTSCKIEDKQCKIKNSNSNQECKLYYDNYAEEYYCQLRDPDCNTNADLNACQHKDLNGDQKCVLSNDYTQCKVENKVCSDYTDITKCDDANIGTNKKCSWDYSLNSPSGKCREYEIYDICNVTKGECGVKSNQEELNNKKCLFTNSTKIVCKYIDDICTNHFSDCGKKKVTNENNQCVSSYSSNCKEVKIDTDCESNSLTYCTKKSTSTIANDKTKGCYYNDEKTECKPREKQCGEYSSPSDCNDIEKCSYISYIYENNNYCYETETENEQVCKIISHDCKKASDTSIDENKEKCLFVYNYDTKKAVCKKVTKTCREISSKEICNSVSTNSYKCHYLSGSCLNITLDGNCKMNSEDKCIENGDGKLSSTEMCDLIYLSSYSRNCSKREKTCSDITVLNDCNSYQPVNRKCFYISSSSSSSSCKEITVDSQCSINDDKECTGKGCSFKDDKKDHCAYKSASSMLKIRMLILALFFML